MVAFLYNFGFGIHSGQIDRAVFLRIRASAIEKNVAARLQWKLPVVVNPQPIAAEAQGIGIGLGAGGRWCAISYKNVVMETVVASHDTTQTSERCCVSLVVRRGAPGLGPAHDSSGHEVVGIGAPLRDVAQAQLGQKEIVVHQKRPVIHLDEEVVRAVVVEEVAGDAGSLGHPVRLFVITTSIAPCSLIPAISAPVNCRLVQML